jgi:uncharacterized protein YqhQ
MSNRSVAPAAPVRPTHIGGQALIEGIMMRGKLNWAVAVRTPDGSIHVEEHPLPGGRVGWRKWPIARGVWAMYESLSLALKAFSISARYADMSGGGDGIVPAEEAEDARLTPREIGLTMVMGVALAIGLFIVLPAFATNFIVGSSTARPFLWNVVDGALRLVVFFGYIWAVAFIPDIKRVFAYHGAEHKAIHTFEHGLPLDTDTVQGYGTLHVRCGTSFLLMVMVIAIVVFSLVPVASLLALWGITAGPLVTLVKIAIRILLLPLVAGLAYEVTVKWAGSRPDNPLVKVLLWPGMQLQRLTTREPDDGMVEVAIAALSAVSEFEERAAAGAPATGASAAQSAGVPGE